MSRDAKTDILSALEAAHQEATPGEWHFRPGNSAAGDSCDLLMVEVGTAAEDEDPEYAEVLFGRELSESERSANWSFIPIAHNHLPALLAVARKARRLDQLQRENTLYSREHIAEAWIELRAALAALESPTNG